MPIDVGPIRAADFPVTENFLYLNHAGVSPIPARSAEAGIAMLQLARDEGAYRLRKWEELANETRGRFARIVGASPDEVAFVKNTSEGLSFVAAGFPWKTRNVEVRMVPAREGKVRKEDLFAACDGKTRLITLSSVEFSNGYRNDLPGIGEYCQKHGIFFCVDGIQSIGVLPMDVKSFGIDALSADGHKWLLSPEGIGAFYISRDVMEMVEPVILGWHSVKNRFDFENYDFRLSPDARRYEPGSMNTVGISSFNASLELLLSLGVDRIWERVRRLTERVRERAVEEGCKLVSPDHPEERSGIVTFRVPEADNAALWRALLNRKAVCSHRGGGIRVSPHFYNTPEEIDRFFAILREERTRVS
ncbi:MAG: aminotransferase class V-fold PLP-dependent enzyme [Deltaproteobacteria bacterium]|nr:aminotransferase class V-fold PLP-dependent enzyme [Deltaproteobacteria bacterium]